MHLFVFGLGYAAERIAQRAIHRARWTVGGTCRSASRAAALSGLGVTPIVWTAGRNDAAIEAALSSSTHVLASVPPGPGGDPVLAACGAALRAAGGLRWVGYLSSTGVYGDHGGAWVDEASETAPTSARGQRRIAAERAWRRTGLPVHIFRLAGIYGPGRSAIDRVRAGTARRIDEPGQVFSRIHVDDLAEAVLASMRAPDPGAIYNLADDQPASSAEVVAEAARLLGVEPPPLVPLGEADLSPMARSFYAENRRVANARMKESLGITLRYPTYREGLAASLG